MSPSALLSTYYVLGTGLGFLMHVFIFYFSQHSDGGSIDPILLRGIGPWIKNKGKEGGK